MRDRPAEIGTEERAARIADRLINSPGPVSVDSIEVYTLARAVVSLRQELLDTQNVRDEVVDCIQRERRERRGNPGGNTSEPPPENKP